ncbi:MAG: hypothetical protein NTU48_09170 [Legionellales bacterium]|nr:hypothetical protein [Legionellales bacterium]
MAFLLTLLGTDTKFVPGEKSQGILVSETLSFMSTCVDPGTKILASGEPIPNLPEIVVPYRSPGVTVIEGPVTSGSDVYEKIADGVYELLNAMQGREHQFTLMGHSRGAVECIVVSHEIQRIQDTVSRCATSPTKAELIDIICDSPCDKTKAELKKRLEPLKGSEEISFDSILQGFQCSGEGELEISLFALDPVPGVEHETVAGRLLSKVWWKDERHYVIPPIVKDYRQIVLENETSVGFRGIVPKASDPAKTQYKLLNMLGHHGTASGNPLDQTQRAAFLKDADKTRDCQIVTMAQLYDFLGKHGVQFKADTNDVFLTSYFNKYHQTKLSEKSVIESNQFKKEHYDRMASFRSFYEAFNQTFYPAGQEDMHLRWFRAVDDDRKLYTSHLDAVTSLNSLIHFKRLGVINEEHAMLSIGLSLDFVTETQAQEAYIEWFITEFCKINPERALQALQKELAREIVSDNIQNGIISIVKSLIETFLRNGLTHDRKEKILGALRLLPALKSPESTADDPLSRFKEDLYSSLLTEMRQGVDEQVNSQFVDLSDLVFALEDNGADDKAFDAYRVAFSKREQFLSTANNLAEVIDCFSYPDVATQQKFEKQVRRLRYYAEGVELYCAKAMLIRGLTFPEPNTSAEARFIEKVRIFMQGLEGQLLLDNQRLQAQNQEKDVLILDLEAKLEQQRVDRVNVDSRLSDVMKAYEGNHQALDTAQKLLEEKKLERERIESALQSEVDRLTAVVSQQKDAEKLHNAEISRLNLVVRCQEEAEPMRQAEISSLKAELRHKKSSEERLQSEVSRLAEVEVAKARLELEVLRLGQVEAAAASLSNANRAINQELVQLREKVNTANTRCQTTEYPFSGISLQIIGGFAAVIGITAVGLAGAALMLALSWQLVAVASIGAAVAAVGLFAYREGAQRQVKEAVRVAMNQPATVTSNI